MSDVLDTSYDEFPYQSVALPPTHPDRIATLATLLGMHPAPVEHCRVLELGCATGGNLVPMAYALPGSEFVGVDLAAGQIAMAQAQAELLGLRNVAFKQADLVNVDANLGQFDYIIAYGVYSWVPSYVQDAVLRICKQCLAPAGVAFISYNTYPGWHQRGMVRDMLLYHSQHFAGLQAQTAQAWSLLNFLVDATTTLRPHMPSVELYSQLLQGEQALLGTRPQFYFVHEHMEAVNEPVYFHQFVERAAGHGLQYLTDANFASTLPSTLPPAIAATIERIAPHRIAVEQYLDFVVNRTFRQSLLCHAEQRLATDLSTIPLSAFELASSATWVAPGDGAYTPDEAKIRAAETNVLALKSPLVKAAFDELIAIWPQALPFNTLLSQAYAHIHGDDAPHDSDALVAAAQHLGENILRCYLAQAIELRVHTPPFVLEAGSYPVASAVARLEAQPGPTVTNLLHTLVTLDAPTLALLPLLDGTHNRVMLEAVLQQRMSEGTLVLEQDEAKPAPTSEELGKMVEHALHILASSALLLS